MRIAILKNCVTLVLLLISINVFATNYTVNTKADLISKMVAALPGDTVLVANGTYSWGSIVFANKKGSSTSKWIVLQAESFNKVIFIGATYIQFSGKHVLINGFKFTNGNSGANDVIQFRSSSTVYANYCRVTNITIDNYNSDSTGSSKNTGTANGGDTLNRWVSLYGTHNRVDHCTFINKFNGSPTVVVWYDSTNYPARGTSTYHLIDSNYFKKRGYWGNNEGEVIRVGTSVNSRTDGYNVIEYNLFEDGVQDDPEIISNKSTSNTYRYNTFRNHAGGLTLRHGRFCNVYGNFFIKTGTSKSIQYGIRIIDKGHKVYNNYIENLNGNNNSLTSARCPIILVNGVTNSDDTLNPVFASKYFPADSTIVAFNTIVNCSGGAGVVMGYNVDSIGFYQPKGIVVANNLIKMTKGQAVLIDSSVSGSNITYFAEGNIYKATSLGIGNTTGFTSKTLTFGTRTNGILPPPSLVKDAATNTASYTTLLSDLDALGKTRSAIYDVGSQETNGSGNIIAFPLDSTMVGAGTSITATLPIAILSFTGKQLVEGNELVWKMGNETNNVQYILEYSTNGSEFKNIASFAVNKTANYRYLHTPVTSQINYYRLKIISNSGDYTYSATILLKKGIALPKLNIYPNPSIGQLSINASGIAANAFLIITDYLGNTIKQMPFIEGISTISTNQMAKGVYRIQLIQNGETVSSYPFIVAN